jgi:Ca-activated chloride channel family protein
MSFLWPQWLALLALIPLLILGYILLLRRRKKHVLRYASLSIVREAMTTGQRLRRHIPPLLFLASLVMMLVAVARPQMVVTLPSQHDTIILAIDVSGSMRAQDVQPNRLEAALAAVRKFIADQPRSTRIGIVAFAGTAEVAQTPTLSRDDLMAALDRFQLQRGTAVGSGILVSLKMLFPDIDFDLESSDPRPNNSMRGSMRAAPLGDTPKSKAAQEFHPVPPGSYRSAAIILLTDGQATTGPDPVESAKMAAERGVRVFTVGIGTVDGEIIGVEGWSMRVRLDEDTLKKIAAVTNAEYFYAGTAEDISKVYKTLNSKLVLETKETEVSALFAAAAALLAILAGGLSMLWFNRVL